MAENPGVINSVQESVSKFTDTVKNVTNTNGGVVFFGLVLAAGVAFITAYCIYWLINRSINNRSSYLLPASKIPIIATQETSLSADSVPMSSNGTRLSLCFWIYIYDNNKYSGSRRHVLHRGDEGDGYEKGSPYIYLDPITNSMYVTFASKSSDVTGIYGSNDAAILFKRQPLPDGYTNNIVPVSAAGVAGTRLNSAATLSAEASDTDKTNYLNSIRGIKIPYIPLQRWVHVGIVVNEDLNGGSITAYVDGEMSLTVNSMETLNTISSVKLTDGTSATITPPITPKLLVTDIDLNKKGNYFIGGSLSSAVGVGFSGLISKVEIFNHDLNAGDVYNNYLNGPIDNLLSKLGLPAYGVRSPIYKLD
jgi:hypothetical protein